MRVVCLLLVLFAAAMPMAAQDNIPTSQPQQPSAQPATPAEPAAAPAVEAKPAAAPAEQAAPAAVPAATAPVATAKPALDHAHIVFYRQRRFQGYGLEPSIYIDGKQIARMDNGRYFVVNVAPGPHEITSNDKASGINVDAKAGAAYYVKTDIETGFWKGHGKLTMVMPEQGSAEYNRGGKYLGEDKWVAKEMFDTSWSPESK